MMEKYSFLMSVYYKEKPQYLKLSIESMLSQTIKPDEIIIIEDGPLTEELNAVIDQYSSESPRLFHIIKLKTNGGLGRALNVGIKASRNELIARMDSDDISLPTRCEKQLKAFEKNSDVAIIGTQISEFIDNPQKPISSRIVPINDKEIKKFARRRSPFNHPTVMYRKSVLTKLKGYQTSGRKEDLDLFIRMLNKGYKAMNLNEALLLYRSNEDNLLRRKTWKNCSEYIQIMFGFYKKGYCGLNDMIYVTLGQIALFITPTKVTKILNDNLLRKKVVRN